MRKISVANFAQQAGTPPSPSRRAVTKNELPKRKTP
jgi:hypothetical protein